MADPPPPAPAPTLAAPEPYGFVYLGFYAAAPQKRPFYAWTPQRRQEAARLAEAAESIGGRQDVSSVRVFRAHLVPPIPGAPRHDLAMLIRTAADHDLDRVRRAEDVMALGGQEILVGRNAGRFGDTEADTNATFLLNHFTVNGDADPVEAWLALTGWYARAIGVDNSTALRATEPSGFPLVNYVRLPSAPVPFLLQQLARPSFHRTVRGTLKANGMRALPGFYRMVH